MEPTKQQTPIDRFLLSLSMKEIFYNVAVNAPLQKALTYRHNQPIKRGQAVTVSLGRRKVTGFVLGPSKAPNTQPSKGKIFQVKAIEELHSHLPLLPEAFIQWLEWLSNYYQYPVGQVSALCTPPLKKADPLKKRKTSRQPVIPLVKEASTPLPLTREQQQCFDAIKSVNGFSTHLLHGVTGSGKTEVYLRLMQECLQQEKQALLLVPEISLTPQLIHRFAQRFPQQIAVIHSHLSEREKTDQWWSVIDKERQILVGARSALFCPIKNLGLIIVDEEHDSSFKQDEKLKYHARDAAIVLAKNHNAPIVLGSATPSLESWHNALEKKYLLHQMQQRVDNRPLPQTEIIDLRQERQERREATLGETSHHEALPRNVSHRPNKELPFWLSQTLYEKMQERLAQKEQVALFLNRRGLAQVVQCHDCGHVYECPNCAISLTLHSKSYLTCHYCNYSQRFRNSCTQCESQEVSPPWFGNRAYRNRLKKTFPPGQHRPSGP